MGSAVVALVATMAALSVMGVVPVFGVITDEGAGGLVVGGQLILVLALSILGNLPVLLRLR